MNKSNRDRNIAQCQGWSFYFDDDSRYLSRLVIVPGEAITLTGEIVNDGCNLGTVYVRAQITRSHLAPVSYQDGTSTFDTHRDLNAGAKSSLRIVDIEPGKRKLWSVDWVAPADLKSGHFDFQIEVWNPPKLFDTPGEYLFHQTETFGGFEILDPSILSPKLLTFISYSHDSVEHGRWTMRLVEELMRHGIPSLLDNKDAEIGGAFDKYMLDGIAAAPVILLICSERYVDRAEAHEGGVGFEMKRVEKLLKQNPRTIRVVPIIRNNTGQRLPAAIRNIVGVDMRGDDWREQPLRDLVRAIRLQTLPHPRDPPPRRKGIFAWFRSFRSRNQ